MANGNEERWLAQCPKCNNGNIVLAPANQYNHNIPFHWDLYCPECRWTGQVADHYKTIYVRM